MSRRPITIGVLGCASIADRLMIPAIRGSNDIQLMAVASRSPERARAFAARHETRGCTYDELVEMDGLDAIYLPLPVGLHYEWGLRAIEAGRHVLIEKTFTERLSQAADLVSRASRRGLVAMEALMYRFHPAHFKLRTLIRDGAVGNVRHISAQFGMPLLPPDDIRRQKQLGGGASLDSLVYPLSLCLELVNEPAVATDTALVTDEEGLDVRGAVQMRWPSVIGQFAFGMGFSYRNECKVWGSDGSLSLERAFTRPPDMAAELILKNAEGERRLIESPANHFELLLGHFVARVRGEVPIAPVEGERLLDRMRWIERIRVQGGILRGSDA